MNQKYDLNELKKLASNSKNQSEMMSKLGLVPRGSNYSLFRKNLLSQGVDISHWKKRQNPPPPNKHTKETVINKILIKNGLKRTSYHIKELIFKFSILKELCVECGSGPIWNNKKLVLHLDHINGDFRDNRIENLRILCPNCHSQTSTYCRKK